MEIGDWIAREKRRIPHLVDSIVAGDVVTRCGRRMRDEPNADGPLVLASFSVRPCRVCAPPATETAA